MKISSLVNENFVVVVVVGIALLLLLSNLPLPTGIVGIFGYLTSSLCACESVSVRVWAFEI